MSTIIDAETTAKAQTQPRGKVIAYWVTTSLLAFFLGSGGIGELSHQWGTLGTVEILGYPVYFLTILGIWKVLGTIAILLPGLPRLKEWAYAGIFFGMTGAAASHAIVGDYGAYAFHIFSPLSFAILALASWTLRPKSRRL
ncbi:DoxX family protein [Paenibacillus sp. LMG 31458]|uniref:DoxX family protein n=1 Tax=Paenibacillus phytorum TaxID=2654977 RepID=A0ABX1Y0V3_9BACL|nr:DoxX family protein [Paenibacillus phytorum]NOU73911.1 DoxX family protein [Paenibacillus phytorum]